MRGTHLIEVAPKRGTKDPLAAEITEDLKQLGTPSRCQVATSKLYRLIGQLTPEQEERAEVELLSDPVVEEVRDASWVPGKAGPARKGSKSRGITVDVWYKQGVTDAVGESVLKGLHDLNLDDIQDVRTGMRYRFIGLKDPKVAEKLALAVLINPLIHDRFIHVD